MQKHYFDSLVPVIYEAAFSDDLWPHIAKELSVLFGGSAIGIDSHSGIKDLDSFTAASLFDTSLRDLHYEGYDTPETNPGVAALLRATIGRPFAMQSFVSADTYDRDPSIQAILKPQNLDKGVFVTLGRDHTGFEFMSVFRNASQDDFDLDHTRAVAFIGQHIARSIRLRRMRLSRERALRASNLLASQNSPLEGVLVVGSDAKLFEADPGPTAILSLDDALSERGGYLVSRVRTPGQDQRSLLSFLSQAPSESLHMVLTTGAASTVLEKLPAAALMFGSSRSSHAQMLHIRRVPLKPERSISGFSVAFALTNAEARVIEALIKTDSATEAAAVLRLSRETVKTHLNRIYEKTEVRSLSQLMLLVGRFV